MKCINVDRKAIMADGTGRGNRADPHAAEAGKTAKEEKNGQQNYLARLRDHSFCDICGHQFYDPRLAELDKPLWSAWIHQDPLQREEDYLVHYMVEHMVDELGEGRITDDDVDALAAYLDISKDQRRKMVLGLSQTEADKDPILARSFRHHSRLGRIENCIALFFTFIIVYIIYQAKHGGENNPVGRLARSASSYAVHFLRNSSAWIAGAAGSIKESGNQDVNKVGPREL